MKRLLNKRSHLMRRNHSHTARIKVGDLRVIPSENRAIDENWRKKLATNWDIHKQGTLVVNDRLDGFPPFVIVGQHRTLAARDRFGPNFEMDAQVYVGLTPEEESEIWLGHDDERRNASPLDVFSQKLRAARPEETSIAKTLANYGLHVGKGRASTTLNCPVALSRAYRKGVLADVIEICQSAWSSFVVRAWQQAIISGLTEFITSHPDHDRASLVAKLSKVQPDNLIAMGRGRMGTGTSVAQGVRSAIEDIYNKGRRSGRLS